MNPLPPRPPGEGEGDGTGSARPEEDGVGSPLDPEGEGDKIGAWGEGDVDVDGEVGDGGIPPSHEVSPMPGNVHLPEHASVVSPSVAPYLPFGHLVHCWFGLRT